MALLLTTSAAVALPLGAIAGGTAMAVGHESLAFSIEHLPATHLSPETKHHLGQSIRAISLVGGGMLSTLSVAQLAGATTLGLAHGLVAIFLPGGIVVVACAVAGMWLAHRRHRLRQHQEILLDAWSPRVDVTTLPRLQVLREATNAWSKLAGQENETSAHNTLLCPPKHESTMVLVNPQHVALLAEEFGISMSGLSARVFRDSADFSDAQNAQIGMWLGNVRRAWRLAASARLPIPAADVGWGWHRLWDALVPSGDLRSAGGDNKGTPSHTRLPLCMAQTETDAHQHALVTKTPKEDK